jgi:hypothetical protein
MMIGWCNAGTRCTEQLCKTKAALQKSPALLPYHPYNEHRENDSRNHSPPNVSFGGENNRKLGCYLYSMIMMTGRERRSAPKEKGT